MATQAPIDPNTVKGLIALDDTTGDSIAIQGKTTTGALYVHLDSSDVALGGGTQYTEGDTDASITGTALMWEDAANTLATVSAANPLPVSASISFDEDTDDSDIAKEQELPLFINENYIFSKTADNWVRQEGTDDGITFSRINGIYTPDGDLAMNDTSNSVVVSGDVTATVTATNLDIRDLTHVSDSVKIGDGTDLADVIDAGTYAGIGAVILDGSGDPITSFGGGTQYTDADVEASPVGTVAMGTDGSNVFALDTDADGQLQIDVLTLPNVTNAGTFAVQEDGDALTALQLIDDVVYAEDSGHTTGDKGVFVLGVRNEDGDDFSGTDKDYIPIALDAKGHVFVRNSDETFTVDTELTTADLDTGAGTDTRAVVGLVGSASGGAALIPGSATDGLLVNLGANNDVTLAVLPDTAAGDLAAITAAVEGTLTIEGTVTANLSDGDAAHLSLLADTVYVDDADWTDDTSKHLLVGGLYQSSPQTVTDGDVAPFLIDANGRLAISDGGGAITVDGSLTVDLGANNDVTVTGTVDLGATDNAVLDNIALYTAGSETALELLDNAVDGNYLNTNLNYAGTDAATGNGTAAGSLRVTVASDSTGVLSVDDNGGALTVDGTVTANLSATDNQVLDDISADTGNIDTKLGTIDTDTGNIATAVQLIDDAIYVDDADWTADTSKHALVGGVTQATPTANTDGDTTPLITNALRELRTAALESDLAAASTTHVHKYYTASTPTDGIIWSPAAGKRWYVTHLSINVSAASTVTIEDDKAGGDDPVYKAEFAANSGVVLTFPEVPLFSGEDAADLTVTASAGTVYVLAVGYEI